MYRPLTILVVEMTTSVANPLYVLSVSLVHVWWPIRATVRAGRGAEWTEIENSLVRFFGVIIDGFFSSVFFLFSFKLVLFLMYIHF